MMQLPNFDEIKTQYVDLQVLHQKKINLAVIRFDLLHPVISGNKWFKLKYYIADALEKKKPRIASYGGAWSNHIVALAAFCKQEGLECTGIIRGEEPQLLSPILVAAKELGMQLVFINRNDYARKILPAEMIHEDYYLVPEGGFGTLGATGAATMMNYFPAEEFNQVFCAVGTGTMMAGLINSSLKNQEVTGISVLKGNADAEKQVRSLLTDTTKPVSIIHDYHFGGYAKHSEKLIDFMNCFFQETTIPTDIVYTGKLLFGLVDLIQKDALPAGSNVAVVHSGGLQGNLSLKKGTLIF